MLQNGLLPFDIPEHESFMSQKPQGEAIKEKWMNIVTTVILAAYISVAILPFLILWNREVLSTVTERCRNDYTATFATYNQKRMKKCKLSLRRL